MFSFLKPKAAPTFKANVEKFWQWYAEVASRFYQVVDSGKSASLANEVNARIDALLPGFAWCFGPGANGQGHSFTLSGEGMINRQLLAQYWLSRAPSLAGWTFHASRQPDAIGTVIDIGEQRFKAVEFWLTPTIDTENERIDLAVWHPLLSHIEERHRWTVLFLFLDEMLGEYGTQRYIGHIAFQNDRLTDAMPMAELPSFVEKTQQETGWKKYPPGEAYTGYSCKEPGHRFLRDDIIAGTTAHFRLTTDYSKAEGNLEDQLAGTGADFVFVSLDASILPKGSQSDARGKIEDALDEALKSAKSGRVLGGAHGIRHAYIDLLIYDGSASLDIIRRILREQKLPSGTEIHFFAKEKRGHRVVL